MKRESKIKSSPARRVSSPLTSTSAKTENNERRRRKSEGNPSSPHPGVTRRRHSSTGSNVSSAKAVTKASPKVKKEKEENVEFFSASNSTESPRISLPPAEECIALKLPPEVLIRIFTYFTIEELGTCIGRVCRYWFTVSRDPLLWRNICIRRHCSLKSAIGLLSYATQPEIVQISNYHEINSLLKSTRLLDAGAASFRCLDLGFSEMKVSTLQYAFMTSMPRLVHLNLEGCRAVDLTAIMTICSACVGGTLERVNLSHCVNLCDESVDYLCRNQPRLTHINLDGIEWISDGGVNRIVNHLMHQLEALWLDGANLSNSAIHQLASCPRLWLLSLRFCEKLSNLIPLTHMGWLRSLTLRKATQVDTGHVLDMFSPQLSNLGCLTYLDLSECCVVTDDVVTVLCKLCGHSLLHLILDWCWEVTDMGLDHVTTYCVNLERLSLAGLHNLSGIPLRRFPEVLPKLFILNLANCNRIQDDLIQQLVDANPTLIAFNYYGDRFETEGRVHPELQTDHDLWRLPNKEYTRVCAC